MTNNKRESYRTKSDNVREETMVDLLEVHSV